MLKVLRAMLFAAAAIAVLVNQCYNPTGFKKLQQAFDLV